MNVNTGTLRNMYRTRRRLRTLGLLDSKNVSSFEGEERTSFKKWVKLNVRVIRKYCKDRFRGEVPYTDAAEKLLGI